MSSGVKAQRRYDSSGRQQQASRNRMTMLQSARSLFLDRGFGATTMPAVAAEAGVSVQTVYKAFGNKAGLAKAVFDVTIAGDDDHPDRCCNVQPSGGSEMSRTPAASSGSMASSWPKWRPATSRSNWSSGRQQLTTPRPPRSGASCNKNGSKAWRRSPPACTKMANFAPVYR